MSIVTVTNVLSKDECEKIMEHGVMQSEDAKKNVLGTAWEPVRQLLALGTGRAVARFVMGNNLYAQVHWECLEQRFLSYEVGYGCGFHIDGNMVKGNFVSTANIIIFLTDGIDREDGAICFPMQKLYVSAFAGSAVIFPTSWTHPHGVHPVKSPRFVLAGWLFNPIAS